MTSELNASGRRLGPLSKIPVGEGRTFIVDGVELAVFRTRNGDLFAVQSRCPHRGGLLADGLLGDGKIVCPLHGYTFELTSGQSLGQQPCESITTYSLEVTEEGDLLIDLQRASCAG
ncbi:MAG: Rieske 2Fe-2S domain-containing protein [Gemmatimonas sp.]|nr:Rieske 2Fe-2S domain-containing protein [Gemmatimonas sp.]